MTSGNFKMNKEDLEKVNKMFADIETKIAENKKLSLEEQEMYGLLLYREKRDIHKLDENLFSHYKFRHLCLLYSNDFSFNSTYYKPNFDKNPADYFDYEKLREINQEDFDSSKFEFIQNLRKQYGLIIPIGESEVKADSEYLIKKSEEWANKMLEERQSDRNLSLIAKETRDTIRKANIENFLSGTVTDREKIDIRKALLKSKYIHNEANKILEMIKSESFNPIFRFNGQNIHYDYSSIIHILNSHFGQDISNAFIADTKTFHSPKINPYTLHKLLSELFQKIEKSKLISDEITKNYTIYIEYFDKVYALYIDFDKLDKTKLLVRTFYEIDENNSFGKKEIDKIKEKYESKIIDKNLKLYVKKL